MQLPGHGPYRARVFARGDLVVAYTAMHGVGAETTRAVFAAAGLAEPTTVPEKDSPRRSVYLQVRRTRPVSLLTAFDEEAA